MSSSSVYHDVHRCKLHGHTYASPQSNINPRHTVFPLDSTKPSAHDCKCRVRELPAFGHPPDVLPAQILSRPDVVPVQVGVDEQELLNAHRNAPDGKLHVHKCLWDSNGPAPCDMWVEGTRISISRHLQNWHGVGPCDKRNMQCLWGGCGKELQGENMARHLLSGSHLEAKVACSKCKSPLAREDAFLRHKANSGDCKDATMTARPGSGGRDVDSCLIFGPRAR